MTDAIDYSKVIKSKHENAGAIVTVATKVIQGCFRRPFLRVFLILIHLYVYQYIFLTFSIVVYFMICLSYYRYYGIQSFSVLFAIILSVFL